MSSFFPYSFNNFLKMNSHSLTNFTVSRNHVTTIVSHIELLLFFARDPAAPDAGAGADADVVLHNISCASVSLPCRDLGKLFSSYP